MCEAYRPEKPAGRQRLNKTGNSIFNPDDFLCFDSVIAFLWVIIWGMESKELAPPIWVDHQKALHNMVEDLSACNLLAVDTESNSLYAYQEQVCLIQFSTETKDYLVDTLALDDITILGPIFSEKRIEKVFHAAEYDLICLKRDFSFTFCNLFDTMLAARILGQSGLGLGSLLQAEFGIKVDKRFQRANWGKRPLPPEQLAYARKDTHYLIPLRQRLLLALEQKNRLELAREDFKHLCHVEIPQASNGKNSCFRVPGRQELSLQQSVVLNELCQFVDYQAQQADLPPFKIIGKQVLLKIAAASPDTKEELLQIPGLSRRQVDRHGAGLLQAVQRGLNKKPQKINNSTLKPDEHIIARVDALRLWRKELGREMGVESDVILPRDLMEQIARENPQNREALKGVMQEHPWRFEHFGDLILQILYSS